MKFFGNSAYASLMVKQSPIKKKLYQLLMVMKIIFLKKNKTPHFKDLELLHGQV
jgi:hypothetical protein